MFPYLENLQSDWLTALLVLWAIFLFGGFAFGRESAERRIPRWARMASSATLVLAGWSWYLFASGEAKSYALFIATGMTLGLAGDLFLAGYFPGGRNVLGGIAAFGLGHVFYIVGMLRFSNQAGLADLGQRWGALLVWWVATAVIWYFLIFRGQVATTLHWAALPYALLLASTTGLATGLALQNASFWGLAIGAALFLLSDFILAAELFAGLKFKFIGDVIWLTYGPGQMLIVYSVANQVSLPNSAASQILQIANLTQ
jgi:hypothetical protein